MKEHGVEPAYLELEKSIARFAKAAKGEAYLSTTRQLLEQPTRSLDFATTLTDQLHKAAKKLDFDAMLHRSSRLLDVHLTANLTEQPTDRSALEDAITRIKAAKSLCELAFAEISLADQELLDTSAPKLLADFIKHIYIHKDESNKAVWEHAKAIRWAPLYDAALLLTPLMTREFMIQLRNESKKLGKPTVRPPGVKGRLLFARKTSAGWIVIGAAGKNEYDGRCAFILDIGGDDIYRAAATASSREQRINVVIDAKGNDLYDADQDFAQGCGRFGVSLLVDHRGDDVYRAKRVAQGASFAGIGILADYRGQDRYEGDAFVQGVGAFGVGLLFDREGDDKMSAHLSSQGFAWPLSVGLLVDLAGKDERIGTGKYGSSYGTKGKFNGMCQGASFGFRTLACGGFGVLIDGGGDDVSRVGEFGHGCGYFFGTGIVRDYGGNDQVEASRYGIATGAHFGVSVVIDDKGDDVWKNPSVAALAGNWDLTVSCFVDRRGADRYEAGGLAIGCATITSFAAFFDLDGKDTYVCPSTQAFGRAGHAQDVARNTQSVALFVDLGRSKDEYPKKAGDGVAGNRQARGIAVEMSDKFKGTAVAGRGVFVDR